MKHLRFLLSVVAASVGLLFAAPAKADLKLSQLIVELQQGGKVRDDIELWNDSPDRAFVAVEPREIVKPGSPDQSDRRDPDPQRLGLLVSPSRVILEPGQRRLLRVASLTLPSPAERVYRVTVKPVAGDLKASASGVKILVGYDVLVLVRPSQSTASVTGVRTGGKLVLRNAGNTSVELVDGQQCDQSKSACSPLGGKRLYAGGSWTVDLSPGRSATFTMKAPGLEVRRSF